MRMVRTITYVMMFAPSHQYSKQITQRLSLIRRSPCQIRDCGVINIFFEPEPYTDSTHLVTANFYEYPRIILAKQKCKQQH